jgi:hypothetical protein
LIHSNPAPGNVWDMGTIKAIVGLLVIAAVFYAVYQIIPPELSNYAFTDDLKNIAMMAGSNPRTTEQDMVNEVMKKAQDHEIPLTTDEITVQRIGSPGAPAFYVAADYSVPVNLPGYTFSLHFTPSSGNKGF